MARRGHTFLSEERLLSYVQLLRLLTLLFPYFVPRFFVPIQLFFSFPPPTPVPGFAEPWSLNPRICTGIARCL